MTGTDLEGVQGMERRRLLAAGVATGVAGGIASSRGYADGGNGEIDRDIVGSWFGTTTATNPPLGSFNDLISFHVGGVLMESRRYLIPGTPFGNLLETTGHGVWKRTGKSNFEAFFRFLLQNSGMTARHRDRQHQPLIDAGPKNQRPRWIVSIASQGYQRCRLADRDRRLLSDTDYPLNIRGEAVPSVRPSRPTAPVSQESTAELTRHRIAAP